MIKNSEIFQVYIYKSQQYCLLLKIFLRQRIQLFDKAQGSHLLPKKTNVMFNFFSLLRRFILRNLLQFVCMVLSFKKIGKKKRGKLFEIFSIF